MAKKRVIVVGGGAAGFFAAITVAEATPGLQVVLLEKTAQFLAKVKISGGGRCNVTHACFDARELTARYPRGERALIGPFHRFQASDVVNWFQARGVELKAEADGRMFPVTDRSQTVIDCLLTSARQAGVTLLPNRPVERIQSQQHGFVVHSAGEVLSCDAVLLATGGCRTPALGQLAVALGHNLAPPVPSLFTFHIEAPWLRVLSGMSLENVEVSVLDAPLRERGAVLMTHWGLSGPVILRLSAWGARILHDRDYRFSIDVNWLPNLTEAVLDAELLRRRTTDGARKVVNVPIAPIPARLWEALCAVAGVPDETRWSALSRSLQRRLVEQLLRTRLDVTGKSLNKDEFVTCGGVALNEVNFKTMESRLCPGLYFAGELLDIDGITGGFNFQAAWTTGWIAGQAMAEKCGAHP